MNRNMYLGSIVAISYVFPRREGQDELKYVIGFNYVEFENPSKS